MITPVHLMMALWMAAAATASPAPGKLAPAVSKEMTEAIVAEPPEKAGAGMGGGMGDMGGMM